MTRKKLKKFAEIREMENVFDDPLLVRGKWGEIFGNDNPIVLELGCGAGQYTLRLAEKYPDKNFIGVDKKGDRVWIGAKEALGLKLKNTGFAKTMIEKIDKYFIKDEVDEIWITFPDPFPKPSKHKRRLSSLRFLESYRGILKKGGIVHLKTDHLGLFEYSQEVIAEAKFCKLEEVIEDVHGKGKGRKDEDLLEILTHYEKRFMKEGLPIYYLRFQLN
jgi:tRNA (guanine-N7-)-methyltransferase